MVISLGIINLRSFKREPLIVKNQNAIFCEIYLKTKKEHAVARLMKRGSWGEAGLPPLTQEDMPRIIELYEHMESATDRCEDVANVLEGVALRHA